MSIEDEWIKKMCYIFAQWNVTLPLKKNIIMPFAATWMDLEIILISQIEKDKYTMLLICGI